MKMKKNVVSAVADMTVKQYAMKAVLVFAAVFALTGMMSTGMMIAHHTLNATAAFVNSLVTAGIVTGIYAMLTLSRGRVMA